MAQRPWSNPAVAILIAGAGLILAALAILAAPGLRSTVGIGTTGAAILDIVLVEGPLVVAVVIAVWLASRAGFAEAVGIRQWRILDVLAGVSLGLLVRAAMEVIAPTTGGFGGSFGPPDVALIVTLVVGFALVSPLVEELFFRGLLLRALVDALGGSGRIAASVIAVVLSTIAFVALHTVTMGAVIPWAMLAGVTAVGIGCGVVTIVTGRLGGALALHLTFNVSGVALMLAA